MVLNSICIQIFHYLTVAWEKISLYLSPSVHIGKDILILGKDPTQGLDSTTLTAEAQYSINFSGSTRKFCLYLHFIGSSSFLFVNATKLYQFKARDSEIKKNPRVQEIYQGIF